MSLTRRSALLSLLATGVLALVGCASGNTQQSSDGSPAEGNSGANATPTPTGPADPLPTGIVNAIIIGTDSRNKDFSGNTDAIMVAQISADRKTMTLVSIARDTYLNGNKANAAYPAGGIDLLKKTVSDALGGIDIHLTAHTNFTGFVSITRWMEGITVFNKHKNTTVVQSTGREVVFEEGEILLENTDALIYARERKALPNGDLDRAERHRALITGLLKGLQKWNEKSPTTFSKLAKNLADQCQISGLDKAQVPDLVTPLMQIDTENINSLMLPLSGFGNVGGQSVNMVDEARAAELGEALKQGDVSSYIEKYGTEYAVG
ncbi:LCP family protein [Pseudoclavibacter albus]|uniref:LCP family protein n=1 Tax=Pseudoclavibacter albus TaxID=272241 RepID=UPI000826B2C2|nr:LCP family protein [Pseudoclavibacter alba]